MPTPKKRKPKASQLARIRLKKNIIVKASVFVVSTLMFLVLGKYLSELIIPFDIPPLGFLVDAPEFLPWGEEENIRVSVENKHDNDVQVKAGMSGSMMPVFIGGPSGTNIFFNGMIQKREQIQRQVSVSIPGGLDLIRVRGQIVGLSLGGSVDGHDFGPQELPIRLAPIPRHKMFFHLSLLALVVTFLSAIGDWKKEMDLWSKLVQLISQLRSGGVF